MKILLALTLLLAGCIGDVEPAPGDGPLHAASGSFTTDRTQDDLAEFGQMVDKYDGEWVLMESWPEQFRATMAETNCYLFVQEVEDLDYVANVGACRQV